MRGKEGDNIDWGDTRIEMEWKQVGQEQEQVNGTGQHAPAVFLVRYGYSD